MRRIWSWTWAWGGAFALVALIAIGLVAPPNVQALDTSGNEAYLGMTIDEKMPALTTMGVLAKARMANDGSYIDTGGSGAGTTAIASQVNHGGGKAFIVTSQARRDAMLTRHVNDAPMTALANSNSKATFSRDGTGVGASPPAARFRCAYTALAKVLLAPGHGTDDARPAPRAT